MENYRRSPVHKALKLFCFSVCALLACSVSAYADKAFEQHYERAVLAYRSEQDAEALQEFKLSFKINPLPRLLLYIARVHLRRGEAQLAIDIYEQYRKAAGNANAQDAAIVEEGLAKAAKLIKQNEPVPLRQNMNKIRQVINRLPPAPVKEFKPIAVPLIQYKIQTNAIAGKGPNDIWVAGQGGVFHFDGAVWQQSYKGWGQALQRVYDAGQGRLWAAGGGGLLLFYDKSLWHTVESPATSAIIAVWQEGPTKTWIMDKLGSIWHSEGTEWVQIPTYDRGDYVLNDAYVLDAHSVWAVGGGGKVAHWNGQKLVYSVSDTRHSLLSVWAAAENCVWAVGVHGTALQFDGTLWKKTSLKASDRELTAVSGVSCANVCITSRDSKTMQDDKGGAVTCFDGQRWDDIVHEYANDLNAVWLNKKGSFWAAGNKGAVIHFDGAARSESHMNSSLAIMHLWGRDAADIWAVGKDGLMGHFDGNRWTTQHSRTSDELKDISYIAANDIWAIGSNGTLLHFDGTTWQRALSNARENFSSIVAINHRTLWAVGDYGLACHYNGDLWMCNNMDQAVNLGSLWASLPNNVWAIDKGTRVWRYDGQKWSIALDHCKRATCLDSSSGDGGLAPLRVWGRSSDDVSVDTERGPLHFDGSQWSPADPSWQLLRYRSVCQTWPGPRRWLAVSPSANCNGHVRERVLLYSDDNKNWREFPYRMHHTQMRALLDDGSDHVWVGGDEGIRVIPLSESVPISNNNESCQGIVIIDVGTGSVAEQSDLKFHDIIASYDHKCIHSTEHFTQLVDSTPATRTVDVAVWRDGQRKERHVRGGRLGIQIEMY